jgi:hypothetical protein
MSNTSSQYVLYLPTAVHTCSRQDQKRLVTRGDSSRMLEGVERLRRPGHQAGADGIQCPLPPSGSPSSRGGGRPDSTSSCSLIIIGGAGILPSDCRFVVEHPAESQGWPSSSSSLLSQRIESPPAGARQRPRYMEEVDQALGEMKPRCMAQQGVMLMQSGGCRTGLCCCISCCFISKGRRCRSGQRARGPLRAAHIGSPRREKIRN